MLRPGPSQGRPQQGHRPAGAARLTTRLSSRSSFICSSMGSLPRLCCCASAAALAQCLLNLMPPSLSSTGDVSPLPLKSTSAGLFLSPQSLSLSSIQLCVFFFLPSWASVSVLLFCFRLTPIFFSFDFKPKFART